MSIESLEDKELNQNQIDIVSGGDDGDYKKELSETPEGINYLYSVGQYVEVYDNSLHWTTERAQIISVRSDYVIKSGVKLYYPLYSVWIEKTGEIREVKSDEIES